MCHGTERRTGLPGRDRHDVPDQGLRERPQPRGPVRAEMSGRSLAQRSTADRCRLPARFLRHPRALSVGRFAVNLHAMLLAREAAGRPVTVGLIGAGKFGTMFLAQVRSTRGMHLVGLADLDIERARRQLRTTGWDAAACAAPSLGDAFASRRAHVTADALSLIAFPDIEVVVEATGVPEAGICHALAAIAHGKHIVMVNVEADAVAGPLLARKARAAGVVYSLAWGDQPALICDHVDWARSCGFKVVAAGKGTRYEPHYHRSTPDTVWEILDKYLRIADRGSINPKMFNSFVDGTKSGIEMTAVCNATGLLPQSNGLGFLPASRFELADVCKPRSAGGALAFAKAAAARACARSDAQTRYCRGRVPEMERCVGR